MRVNIHDAKEGRVYFVGTETDYQGCNHIKYDEETKKYTAYRAIGPVIGRVGLWSTVCFEDALDWLLRTGTKCRAPIESEWTTYNHADK